MADKKPFKDVLREIAPNVKKIRFFNGFAGITSVLAELEHDDTTTIFKTHGTDNEQIKNSFEAQARKEIEALENFKKGPKDNQDLLTWIDSQIEFRISLDSEKTEKEEANLNQWATRTASEKLAKRYSSPEEIIDEINEIGAENLYNEAEENLHSKPSS